MRALKQKCDGRGDRGIVRQGLPGEKAFGLTSKL